MAITIKVQPQEFQSTYNNVMIVLDSNKKNELKFQYVVDVNINGVYSSRLKVQSNPQGFGIIDLSKHLESAISSDVPNLTTGEMFNGVPNSFAEYDIVLHEEYVQVNNYSSVIDTLGYATFNITAPDDTTFSIGDNIKITGLSNTLYDGFQTVTAIPTATSFVTTKAYAGTSSGAGQLSADVPSIIEDQAAVFTGTKYITNNVLSFVDVPNWDYEDFKLVASDTKGFLTNLSTSYYSRLDDNITLNIKQSTDFAVNYLKVVTNLGTYFFENQHAIPTDATQFVSVKVGAGDLPLGTLSGASSTFPMFDDATVSYTIQTVGADYTTVSSEIRTFIIDRDCTRHDNVSLIYLNNGGSFSPYNFTGGSKKKTKVDKKNYQKNIGAYDSVSDTYGYDTWDAGTTRLSTTVTETWSMTSTWLPESVGALIEDLIISPQVFEIASNGVMRAIDIKTSSIKLKRKSVEKLISYSIDFEYSTNNNTQK